MLNLIEKKINNLIEEAIISDAQLKEAKLLDAQNEHIVLSKGADKINVQVEVGGMLHLITLYVEGVEEDKILRVKFNFKDISDWNVESIVALLFVLDNFKETDLAEGLIYTEAGMRKRVWEEREDRALKSNYRVKLAKNLYGEHTLYNEKGKAYKITLRDFEKRTGYINNIDWRTNKLDTTKHILYLYNYLAEHSRKKRKLINEYPFIEIYTDPLNDYKITWYYPQKLTKEEQALINNYFDESKYIENNKLAHFFSFINKAADFERIKIREEVIEKIERYFYEKELNEIEAANKLDFSCINATLYPYQKEGVEFGVFKKGIIIADEMGLGKTLQAITIAILKKQFFDFKRVLVICPATVKEQWKNEVHKFSDEKAIVVQGTPEEREELYLNDDSLFHIINYETVLRDLTNINKAAYDFVILDEAQRIKNYETKTATAVKAIKKQHGLIITGTPIENKLIDLYSVVQFLGDYFLTPQWEFSYQHCVFDTHSKNKIRGYYNLSNLKQRLSTILLRRQKREVFEQLPQVSQQNVYVRLSDEQAGMHGGYKAGIARILGKKYKTPFDWQMLMMLLTKMRMVCDSTYLIDKETNFAPKIIELKHILLEKLDVKNTKRKVIIFSEWIIMLKLIGDALEEEGLTYTMLTGKVPVKKRGAIIKEFEENDDCNIFLSSESGGTGLNLQIADTVINYEIPWNPAKKNQRIGRIDRIGQEKLKLNVFNLISLASIEIDISTGLALKQNLFDGVLNANNEIDEVDFDDKGKSQFISRLEEMIAADEETLKQEAEGDAFYENLELLAEEEAEMNGEPENEIEALFNKEEATAPELALLENELEPATSNTSYQKEEKPVTPDYKEMETVMTKGMEFLTGIFKMSTGKELSGNGKPKVEIDKATGEVSIKFKLDL